MIKKLNNSQKIKKYISSKKKAIENCFICGSNFKNPPKIFNSKITNIPEGLDRSNRVKSYIYWCKKCNSFSCMPIQKQKKYSESLCFEASKKTLENSDSFYPYSSSLIPNSIKDLIKSKTFVDYGCGAGFFTRELQKYVKKVIGVDIDPSSIKSLKENNIEAYEGDKKVLENLQFDSISMVGVLEHFKNPTDFLREINEILPKKNSLFLIYYPNTNSFSSLLCRFFNKPWDMFLEPGHYSFPSKKFLISEMLNSNFKCKKFWTTSNISRGKNPFGIVRNVVLEEFIRSLIKKYPFIKAVYVLLFKGLDFLKLGDINCYFFYR